MDLFVLDDRSIPSFVLTESCEINTEIQNYCVSNIPDSVFRRKNGAENAYPAH